MNIVKYPDPILSTVSLPVRIDRELKDFIDEMYVFMGQLDWGRPVGLAAPQVGKNWRIFIALDNTYINPEVVPVLEEGMSDYKEGCYSLEKNRFDYPTRRYKTVDVKWQDKKGAWHHRRFTGFPAQVIQHEFDHLEGRTCNQQTDGI